MIDETLVTFGGAVKALGGGKVGGWGVLFSTKADPDLVGDFFTAETQFGPHQVTAVYYDHGMDDTLKRRVLDNSAAIEAKDAGIWVTAQLNLRDEYEAEIYKMAEAGKLGWSSGTAAHLVEREADGKAHRITRWPLGLDMSLTPTPCEPRTAAVPLKSWAASRKATGPSMGDIQSALRPLIQAACPCGSEPEDDCYGPWVCDLYGTSVVWECCSHTYEAPYTFTGGVPTLGTPREVQRRVSYVPVGSPDGLTMDDQAKTALAAAECLLERVKAVSAIRAQDGRRLSDARLGQVKALRDALALVLEAMPTTAAQTMATQIMANELALNELALTTIGGK